MKAVEMHSQGARIVDVGAESTRPGSFPVSPEEQRRRLIPVIRAVRESLPAVAISVDTSDPSTAEAAIDEGADIINDVTALSAPGMSSLAASTGTPVILMHMLGRPRNMQEAPCYADPIGEILSFLSDRMRIALDAGIVPGCIWIDPGIGFGKRLEDNIVLIRRLGEFRCLGAPVVLGHSRKSFLGSVTGIAEPSRRDLATAVVSAAAARDADIIRVHDVAGTVQALEVARALRGGRTR
jgi:dihydropteroate synthase